MGSRTPTYRVEFGRVVDISRGCYVGWTSQGYDIRGAGRPTDENLAKFVRALEDTTLPGGVNAHLGVTRIGRARIVRQATGEIVASFGHTEAFEVAS